LNNLNISSSIVPPLLQRQNSAPTSQQQQPPPPPQQQQQTQNQFNDFFKPNNSASKPPTAAASSSSSGHPVDLQRKYSLPMNTIVSQPSTASAVPSSQPPSAIFSQPSAIQPPINIIRKQSAPTLSSTHHPLTIQPPAIITQSQSQFQAGQHGSPSRARDRNLFDKVPTNSDVIQLPFLKG
jgi:hypothetical protein